MTDQTDIDALIKRLREGVSYGTAPYEAAAALETLSASLAAYEAAAEKVKKSAEERGTGFWISEEAFDALLACKDGK